MSTARRESNVAPRGSAIGRLRQPAHDWHEIRRENTIRHPEASCARYGVEMIGVSLHAEVNDLADICTALNGHAGRVHVFDRRLGTLLFEGTVEEARTLLPRSADSIDVICATPSQSRASFDGETRIENPMPVLEAGRLQELNGKLEAQLAAAMALLERQAESLRGLALELTKAEHRERTRLAELIHDHLQQLLVAAKMRINRLGDEQSAAEQAASAAEAKQLIQQAIELGRSLTTELRPPVLFQTGLAAAIQWLAQHTKFQHGIEVATCFEPSAEPAEEDMKAFLYQAVRELIFNAVKHAHTREIRVIATVREPHIIHISVEDEGTGFDPAGLKQKQAANESLGLFNIQERLAAFGGAMRIESGHRAGARIHLELPMTASHLDSPNQGDKLTLRHAATQSATPIKVMLVDDHKLVCDSIRKMLHEDKDIEIIGTAQNGQEAIVKAAQWRPHVIIMDANMPLMNGIEATRHIRRSFPDIQIVGLSVHKDVAIAASFEQAGAAAFLSKDGDVGCLLETIHKCCPSHRARSAERGPEDTTIPSC